MCAVCACVFVGLCVFALALERYYIGTVYLLLLTRKCKHRLTFIFIPSQSLRFRPVVYHRQTRRHTAGLGTSSVLNS